MNWGGRVISVKIYRDTDPDVELDRLIQEESKEDVCVAVDAGYHTGLRKVNRTVKALLRLSKPHWRLVLKLECNRCRDVPTSVWKLVDLIELRLDHNHLETISPAIAKLVKLKKLCIGYNPLEEFPETVCQLKQLEELGANDCRLSVLPSSFASLRDLLKLHLDNNLFGQVPDVVCELKNLRTLRLDNNQLNSLPRSFANLRWLKDLGLSRNCFKEFPRVVCELLKLEMLSIGGNQLSELPMTITKLVDLQYLNLARNSFTHFPLFLGEFSRISYFFSHGWFNHSACFHFAHTIYAGNPTSNGLHDYDLFRFLQGHKESVRLSAIITGGFCAANDTNPWTKFLVRGLYDPRLFLIIFDFAFEESDRKRGRFEE